MYNKVTVIVQRRLTGNCKVDRMKDIERLVISVAYWQSPFHPIFKDIRGIVGFYKLKMKQHLSYSFHKTYSYY